jgi:pimeloyl-ACP methyl ester carboxylesterase
MLSNRCWSFGALVFFWGALGGCDQRPSVEAAKASAARELAPAKAEAPPEQRPAAEPRATGEPAVEQDVASSPVTGVRIEELDETQPPVFVARGRVGPQLLVFLHGMCGHGQGYAQSFQFSAARWGRLIAPQGDVRCGSGPWAKWSADIELLDQRIVDAFLRLGHDPQSIAVIGYSQGGTRAEQLAQRFPDRYRWLILMASPKAPAARQLKQLKSAVMMAGERDRQELMRGGVTTLREVGVPTTFIELPGARHGSMGRLPETTMGSALHWLFSNAKGAATSPASP